MPTPPVHAYAALLGESLRAATPATAIATLSPLVNGVPAATIEQLLSRTRRRNHGIFFSGEQWADRLLSHVPPGSWKRYCDPAVGTGDLLLAVARGLDLSSDPDETLETWSKQLAAADRNASFLQIAWERIRALCLLRHFQRDGTWSSRLPHSQPSTFHAADSLREPFRLHQGDCLLMNPPYTHQVAPAWCSSTTGRVSSAALFVERFLTESPDGVALVALVPDVLRSGSRYKAFRTLLEHRGHVHEFVSAGRFSPDADVDVAIISITVGRNNRIESAPAASALPHVGDHFAIHVGSVVPHRTPQRGTKFPYVCASQFPTWTTVRNVEETKGYKTRTYEGPLVVIRRTSSPSDKKRARATIIDAGSPLLIENHLVVCQPKDGSLLRCEQLMRNLLDPRTDDWLNQRIRCRHLTVGSVGEIPLWPTWEASS